MIIYFPPDYGETGIDLNANIGLDLVFVIDSTSSVRRTDFSTGLRFAKTLVRTIGASKRYDLHMIASHRFPFLPPSLLLSTQLTLAGE